MKPYSKTEKNSAYGILSKLDEVNKEDRLAYLLPQHEYFHQGMVLADCESELFRDGSRGLEGGAFFVATLLNRKEAQTSKGKNSLDSLKDLFLLKADARFIQFFLHKHEVDPLKDNTPDLLKTASAERKLAYLHNLVSECLEELLPFFKESKVSSETSLLLQDHPLQEGRMKDSTLHTTSSAGTHAPLEVPTEVTVDIAEATAAVIVSQPPSSKVDLLATDYLEKSTVDVSSRRTKHVFTCRICSFQGKYETVVLAHIEGCLETFQLKGLDQFIKDLEDTVENEETGLGDDSIGGEGGEEARDLQEEDLFFNYKNGEFFIDSLFAIMTLYERFGDGVGCLIVSKIILPIFYGLHHSNYTSSIHRFVVRVLSEANPREGLKLVHERFSNRVGKPGKNVHRDRRMEFRIGITKKLIENLGPNFSDTSVKQVNHMVDIKEKLFINTRVTHGVAIRSGRHVPRSDDSDFLTLVNSLNETKAHMKIKGRKFGDFVFPENLMDDRRFDRAKFFRWITQKNEEAKDIIVAKRSN